MKLQKYTIPAVLIIIAAVIALYIFFPKATNHIDTGNMAAGGEVPTVDVAKEEINKANAINAGLRGPYAFVAEYDDQNALELLKKYAEVGATEYDFGIVVESINGLASDKENFWAFYVNGEFADKGVGQTTLNAGDVIEFVYEEAEVYKGL